MRPEWQDTLWDEVCRSVAASMRKKEYSAGVTRVNSFLARKPARELRCQALSLRSILKEWLGQLDGAMKDLLMAHSLSRPGSYGRYCCELGLGQIREKQGQIEEATRWYWRSVATCRSAKEIISVRAGLVSLHKLGVNAENLTRKERLLLRSAILRSWKRMRIPGRPDLRNLAATDAALKRAELRMAREASRKKV